MMRDLKGRTVAITGAASGIGRSLALLLASEECHLALADIRVDQLIELKGELESRPESSELRVSIHQVDVSDAEQVRGFAHDAIEHHQSVHLLINNAGVTYMGNFLAHDLATWDHIIRVNLMGVVHGCHAFIPEPISKLKLRPSRAKYREIQVIRKLQSGEAFAPSGYLIA